MQEFHRGDAINLETTVYTDDKLETIKDVTGFTVVGHIGNLKQRDTMLTVTGSIVDGPNGLVRVPLSSANTLALPASELDFICDVTDAGSNPGVVADEKINVRQTLVA